MQGKGNSKLESLVMPIINNPKGQSSIVEAALAYARAGFFIYPSPRKDGAARVRWRSESTRDQATIVKWWTRWPNDLICLDCGKSEIGVIDVDTLEGHGVGGDASLFDAEMSNEMLPETLRAVTPSKGRHLFFRDPGAKLRTTTGKIGPGVDTRGRGGMVVLAPSVVKGKGAYAWMKAAEFKLSDLPIIPQWVLDVCGEPNNVGPLPDAEFEPVYSEEEFEERLNLLDVNDFRDHDKWLSLMLACTHSSTVADGKAAFMAWTTGSGEGEYAADYDLISERWDYNWRHRNKGGKCAKVGTFNKFLEDAGHGDKIKREPEISAAEEFAGDDAEADSIVIPKGRRKVAQKQAADREKQRKLRRRRAIRIVLALLDKTVANGCTEEEEQASKAKAAEIIEKYQLTAEELLADLPPNSAEEEKASQDDFEDVPVGARKSDFFHHGPTGTFIFAPTNDFWPATSINLRFGRGADKSIALNNGVEQATWAPGYPVLIRDKLMVDGQWTDRPAANCYNLYRPLPISGKGDATLAGPWVDHLQRVYSDDAEHILGWFAWRVQRPEVKINHCLVFGGDPGIGKDTILAPVRYAVGGWNFGECNPAGLLEQYNATYLQRVILRVNEARDMGEGKVNRYSFYESSKVMMADPPETLSVMEKYLKRYSILNVVGMVITTNNKTNGLYLPSDDRRHFVAWSMLRASDFEEGYFNTLWGWYEAGGFEHVAAYLRAYDLAKFHPKATPSKTAAFWEIANANTSPEESELESLLQLMGDPLGLSAPGELTLPEAITVAEITVAAAAADLAELWSWLTDRKNRRQIPARFEKIGYAAVRNPYDQRDGLWMVAGKRQTVYARRDLSTREQLQAVTAMIKRAEQAAARDKADNRGGVAA
jgi:hypothetical protein